MNDNMSGKIRPSLRKKTLENVRRSALSETDKRCIFEVFQRVDNTNNISVIKDFANRLMELYTSEIITDEMVCPIEVIKSNIKDIEDGMLDRYK